MEENDQDKSELPTAFKLQRAREKGTVARGMDLGFFISLSVFLLYAWVNGATFASAIAQAARDTLVGGPRLADGPLAVLAVIPPLFAAVARPIVFMASAIFLTVLLFEVIQTGVVFSAQPLKPDFSRLNPAKGLKRLFSLRLLIETAKNIFKLVIYTTVGWLVIRGVFASDLGLLTDARGLSALIARAAFRLMAAFALVALFFTAIDQIIVRRDFLKRMRMSRRELRREHRDREGEPRLKQKRKQLHGEFVKLSQSLRGLRGADMLVTNPQHIALGLRYDPKTMAAPKIVSIGTNRLAQRLKRLAFIYGIPVFEDRPLARELLRRGALDCQIPEHCFQPVANIYNAMRRKGGSTGPNQPNV
jgi:flagellar biosynthetic protein FlhB